MALVDGCALMQLVRSHSKAVPQRMDMHMLGAHELRHQLRFEPHSVPLPQPPPHLRRAPAPG
jgi:hypothetical protein